MPTNKPQYRYIALWYSYTNPFTNKVVSTNQRGYMILKDDKEFEVISCGYEARDTLEKNVQNRVARLNGTVFFKDIKNFTNFCVDSVDYIKLPEFITVKREPVNCCAVNGGYHYFGEDTIVERT